MRVAIVVALILAFTAFAAAEEQCSTCGNMGTTILAPVSSGCGSSCGTTVLAPVMSLPGNSGCGCCGQSSCGCCGTQWIAPEIRATCGCATNPCSSSCGCCQSRTVTFAAVRSSCGCATSPCQASCSCCGSSY